MKKKNSAKGQKKNPKPYKIPTIQPATTGPDPMLYGDKIIETRVTVIE